MELMTRGSGQDEGAFSPKMFDNLSPLALCPDSLYALPPMKRKRDTVQRWTRATKSAKAG
jgi:hypothetical protein